MTPALAGRCFNVRSPFLAVQVMHWQCYAEQVLSWHWFASCHLLLLFLWRIAMFQNLLGRSGQVRYVQAWLLNAVITISIMLWHGDSLDGGGRQTWHAFSLNLEALLDGRRRLVRKNASKCVRVQISRSRAVERTFHFVSYVRISSLIRGHLTRGVRKSKIIHKCKNHKFTKIQNNKSYVTN